jgi:hypothetical protein
MLKDYSSKDSAKYLTRDYEYYVSLSARVDIIW